MYSRSQGREQKRADYDENDSYDDMSDDEYELYRYNLPPKYDGSRFRRNSRRRSVTQDERTSEQSQSEALSTRECEKECAVCEKEDAEEGLREAEAHSKHTERDDGGIQKLLSHFGGRLGYEEILIIALILMIAEEGQAGGDIILLLALLLLEH